MLNMLKPFAIASFAVLILSCQNTAGVSGEQVSSQGDFLPLDKSRNVLSFADSLGPSLPSVVRIGRINKNSAGKLGLGGLGSGAVIDLSLIHI